MKSISKLKDQARAHEQKENWQAAIEAYRKVLSALDDDETELDLSLYNRIGDLFYRVGQPDRAVHYYSQAAQKYAGLGLFNNAIALCNKALRYRPNDVNLFRMLGEFSAEQGFLVEARRWYLQYAERQVQYGKVEEAFAALEEFAALADDPSVRETLADQFLAHKRSAEALQQLERAYKERIARGETMEASIVADRIREMDPSVDLQALAREVSSIEPAPAAAEDSGLIIETSAGAAGFRGESPEADRGERVGQPSGLETRPDDDAPAPADDAVSGLESGFVESPSTPAPGPGGGLADMETFDVVHTAAGEEEAAGEVETTSEGMVSNDGPSEDMALQEGPSVGSPPADAAAGPAQADAVAEEAGGEAPAAFGAEPEAGEAAAEPEPEPPTVIELEADVGTEAEKREPAAPSAFDEEFPAAEGPKFEEEIGDEEEPEPLPLLDLSDDMALEPDKPVPQPGAQEGVAGSPEQVPAAGELPELEGVEPLQLMDEAVTAPEAEKEGAAATEAADGEATAPLEAEATAGAPPPLLDLDEPLLPDLSPEATEKDDVAEFDLSAFDRTLAGAGEGADAGSDVDTAAILGRARELVGRELHDHALGELRLLLVPRLDRQVYDDALRVVNELVRRDPDDFPALQRRVEFASYLGDKHVLAETYADLAACLMRKGAETKAATVYGRVLELDPNNEAAREVLGMESPDSDAYVDLAAFLDDEGLVAALAAGEASAPMEDFAELFSQFKAKVTEDVAVEESGSHYDLGLAFKEMGLIDEAIAEFQTALRGGEERLKVYEELGQCFMLKEQYTVAVKILARALELPREDPHELLGVYYHLGMCHEELGDRNSARQAYDNIMAIDPSFSDVPERLSRL